MNNEMFKSIVGSVVRWLLTGGAAWIVGRGVITEIQSEWILAGIITAVATLLWSLYQKYGAERIKAATAAVALQLPSNTTERHLNSELEKVALPAVDLTKVTVS